MKEVHIANINDIEAHVENRGDTTFSVKQTSEKGFLEKCGASFVEVEPGNYAFGYHYHEINEEIFYIISGEGTLRTFKGEVPVKAGDILSFPTGEGGAHVVKNTGTGKLTYLDIGSKTDGEVVHLPDAKKLMVATKSTFAIFDEPQGK